MLLVFHRRRHSGLHLQAEESDDSLLAIQPHSQCQRRDQTFGEADDAQPARKQNQESATGDWVSR